ncbi:hypothetical protein, partial [Methylovulum psychrotolerans]|uniref:hypothetical protein n=1 Tax=Methylovulum psychrotolerans TaxID=1704499 RepID=UPI001B80695A
VCRAEHRRFCRDQPEGARQGCRASAGGQEPTLPTPDKTEKRRIKRQSGRLFFGYFLLAEQKKVSRLRVREPD